MRLLIAGSRNIREFDLEKYVPQDTKLIISGGASGIDRLAEIYADKHKISKLILLPDYKKYGRGAPLIRNKAMVELADEVLVIWDGKSKGSLYTISCAKKLGKPLTVVQLP